MSCINTEQEYTNEQIHFTRSLLHTLEGIETYEAKGKIIINALKQYEGHRADEIGYYQRLLLEVLNTQVQPIYLNLKTPGDCV